VGHVVVALDVVEVDGLGHAGVRVEITEVPGERRIVGDAPLVALEVADVDSVEAHERHEQPDVGLGQVGAHEVAVIAQALLEPVEAGEQLGEGLLVGVLTTGEAGPVDAVVDRPVHPVVDAVDLVPVGSGVEIGSLATPPVEHPQQIGALVVDDLTAGPVPEHRHRDAHLVGGIRGPVNLAEIPKPVDRIGFLGGEAPARVVA